MIIKPEYVKDGILEGFHFWIELFVKEPFFRGMAIATIINIIINLLLIKAGLTAKQRSAVFGILELLSFVSTYIITK